MSRITVHSPWDGSVVGSVEHASPTDIASATNAARVAQSAWQTTARRDRIAMARRFSSLVLREADDIIDVIQSETGKARGDALEEVLDVTLLASYFAGATRSALRTRRRAGAIPMLTRTREYRHPKGVVGVITPWNYPFTLVASDSLPALLAGNAVIVKPDTKTPLSAMLVQDLLRRAGCPDNLFQVVVGEGSVLGPPLIAAVDYVMFTGSSATGRIVASQCAERLIDCSAELGGKNALLVLDDADVDAAARGAVKACFSNAGQLCVSVERIYVTRRVADRFLPAFVDATRALTLGDPRDAETDIGSLISREHLARVQSHVDDAVQHGATVVCGGRARPELGAAVFEPTILTRVPDSALAAREETFGPVVAVYVVADDAAAIDAANDSPYGLNASAWTTRRRADSVATQLHTGTVNVNEGYAAAWASHDAPMGGRGASGIGRRHGVDGIRKYTESQTVARQHLRPLSPWPGMSNAAYERMMRLAARALNALRRV